MRWVVRVVMVLGTLMAAEGAFACADPCYDTIGCYGVARLSSLRECNTDRPFLDAANDSRANLFMLYAAATDQAAALPTWMSDLEPTGRDLSDPDEPTRTGSPLERLENDPAFKARQAAYAAKETARVKALNDAKASYLALLKPLLPADAAVASIPDEAVERSSEGEQPCHSNEVATASRYLEALVKADGPPAAKGQLALRRHELLMLCPLRDKADFAAWQARLAGNEAPGALAGFASYLRGAGLLYFGAARDAGAAFAELGTSPEPWLRETALYLQARAALIAAQAAWNGYDQEQTIDQTLVTQAENSLRAYLAAYPQGLYAVSASGLQRRVSRLRPDKTALTQTLYTMFNATIAAKKPTAEVEGLINEIDHYATYTQDKTPFDQPLLATTSVLMAVRIGTQEGSAATPEPRLALWKAQLQSLEAHKADFDRYSALHLYAYTRATLLFALGDTEGALAALPPEALDGPLAPSLQVLRARLLDAAAKYADARPLWRALMPRIDPRTADSAIPMQTALAINFASAGQLTEALLPGSGVSAVMLRDKLIYNLASDEQLRDILGNKALDTTAHAKAAKALLGRFLLAKSYPEFLALYSAEAGVVSATFSEVQPAVAVLANKPQNATALAQLGSFLLNSPAIQQRLYSCAISSALEASVRARYKAAHAGDYAQKAPPLSYFLAALPGFKEAPDPEPEAMVLHHAILCFKAGEHESACKWGQTIDVPKATRAAWFKRLKGLPTTKWSRELKYYY